MGFHPKQGLRKKIASGEAVYGIMCSGASPRIVEINARSGVDFLLLDGEHDSGADVAEMLGLIRAADAFGAPAIVRIPSLQQDFIQRVLDYGAIGICAPHIRDAESAARVVAYAKYPPVGDRAMSPYVRAAGYGIHSRWEDYWPIANDEVIVMVMIEDRTGVDNLESIGAVPGVDILYVGAGDLSQSMGVSSNHPSVVEARERCLEVAIEHGLGAYSSLSASPSADLDAQKAQAQAQYDKGYRVFAWNDGGLHAGLMESLSQVRAHDRERLDATS